MRIAVIDMGTNTFHLLVAEVKDGQFETIYREKNAVKIGAMGINKGLIIPEAQERAIIALKRFQQITEAENVEKVFATATSAIRNASNGQELVNKIKQETGIEVDIITGDQEAQLIYYGVGHALKLGNDTSLIMDIGGGSIEFIIGTAQEIKWKHSFEIGGQRMIEQFHKHDPILSSEIDDVRSYLNNHLSLLFEMVDKYRPTILIGSSGTFDTLSDIHRVALGMEKLPDATELALTIEGFDGILKEILVKNREERLAIPGMIELRVDMIVVACLLIEYVLKKSAIKKIRVSAYALKEGVLLNTIHKLDEQTSINKAE
jgi:exopolyphosphatase/guanosine-5'-triphosphate,3'-diphosphate pyrophosphatase